MSFCGASAATVELRPGNEIPRLINGGWQLSDGHRSGAPAVDEQAALDAMLRLAQAGLFAFDGADIYTGVEALYGRFRADHPDISLRVHTKCVPDLDLLPHLTADDVRRGIDRSCARLGVQTLDLVQFHWWDFAVDGWLDAATWLDGLRREGRIRHLAVTNFDTGRLAALLDAGLEIAAHQVQYSLLDRRPEHSMVDLCRAHDVKLLCYGTLAGGFLSDRWLGRQPPLEPLENRSLVKYRLMIDELGGWDAFQELLGVLRRLADRHGVSIANVATAWTLGRPQAAAAIVGFRDARHVEDNLRTLDLRLTNDDLELLGSFLADRPGAEGDVYSVERVVGGRHARIMKTSLNRAS